MPTTQADAGRAPLSFLHAVFFLSGLAAIVYQLVWQRLLFTLYGSNVESITIVVTAFMLGLGLGGLAGGAVSRLPRVSLPLVFSAAELGIGAFGLFSIPLFRWVGGLTAGASAFATGLLSLSLVLLPTMLMGATLPILVADAVRRSGNVGRSLGMLYFTNTLGSAAGAFAAALFLFGRLGQAGSVRFAACVNLAVALAVLALYVRRRTSA